MMRSNGVRGIAFCAAWIGAVGCADRELAGPSVELAGAPRVQQGVVSAAESSGEQLFEELALVAPSSAGFIYEGTDLVVLVADEAERSVARDFVARAVLERRILPPGGGRQIATITSRKVRFSFRTLSELRGRIDALLLGKDRELQFLDLDEAANTITLGYTGDSSAVLGRVKQLLPLTPANEQAVRVERVSRGRTQSSTFSASALMVPGNLGAANSPLVGGLRIARFLGNSEYAKCTLGFTAKRDGVVGFVTNSHCTEDMFGTGGIYKTFHQPLSRPVGTEEVDPYGYTCGVAPPTECRGSDAAFIKSNGAVPSLIGYIAKPATGLDPV